MNRKPIVDRLEAIESRLAAIERVTLPLTPLGPSPTRDDEFELNRALMVQEIVKAAREAGPAQVCPRCGHYAHAKFRCSGGMGDCCDCGHDSSEPEPVDRSCQTLTSGAPVPKDRSHTEDRGDGQQRDYVVLCNAERAKGFVRPVRRSYRHLKCGTITTMGLSIAETYARDPYFYSGTFCCRCGSHFPIGEDGEFVWIESDGSTGKKVGT